ncbi:MAG TPA: hypothetical protein P5246_01505 [Candidatus Omnitrophota bacterium]|jgi:hypothetical protein|nr:hypothetical protein [Candidatus Omnitrophota bacterium]HSA31528.1 hypothetical protein [Candidatus Omnitrophota bacterium]
MRRWILIIGFLIGFMCTGSVFSADDQAIDPQVIELSNRIMQDIFSEVKTSQPKFKELAQFSDQNLFKNAQGIYAIKYEYKPVAQSGDASQQDLPYELAVTIDGMEQWTFEPRKGMFNYGFPLLKLKISGYQKKHPIRTQFDIDPLVKKYGQILADEQQKLMPLKIIIEPTKSSFTTDEDVIVEVVLRNVSKRHMYVRPLNKDTLYFLIDDQYWGTKPTEAAPDEVQKILYSGEEERMSYRIGVFQQPQTIHMMCFYRMAIHGVNPFGVQEISIVEAKK